MADTTTADSSPIDLILEQSIYVGNAFSLILYGLSVYLYGHSLYLLTKSPAHSFKVRRFYVIYGGILLLLITFAVSSNAAFGQQMWINHRNDDGGPLGYFGSNISAWYNTLGSAADITTNFMGDGLLLYRCYIIWGARPYVVAFPLLIYLGSTVTAIITVYNSALPNASIFAGVAAHFGIAWVSLTVSLNIILTAMICTRIILARASTHRSMGARVSRMYTGMIPILVESSLPFSILGIIFIALYVRNNEAELALAFIWGTFCAISPQMIILRVSMGHGWARNTMAQLTDADNGLVNASNQGPLDGAIALDTIKNGSFRSHGSAV